MYDWGADSSCIFTVSPKRSREKVIIHLYEGVEGSPPPISCIFESDSRLEGPSSYIFMIFVGGGGMVSYISYIHKSEFILVHYILRSVSKALLRKGVPRK